MKYMHQNWSVVIPTIWASKRIYDLVASLEACERVQEIILIDNRPELANEIEGCSKLRVISKGSNIFANPAWNLGVSESKCRYVCICSDDVSFDTVVFREIEVFLESRASGAIVGCHRDCFSSKDGGVSVEEGHDLGFGWGAVMFLEGESYPRIPEELRIWAGDRFIIAKASSVFAAKFSIVTEMSTSSGQSIFDDIKSADKVLIQRLLTRWESWGVKASERRNGGKKSLLAVAWTFLKLKWQKLR